MRRFFCALAVALTALTGSGAISEAAPVGRPALVQKDGTLKIGGRIIRLYGIYLPPTARICRSFLQPTRCAARGVLALERKIQGFVFCDPVGRYADGSLSAVCRVRSRSATYGPYEDLAAFLLREGWAVARPGAPFEYSVLERIAQARERGIWGFQVDSITFR